MSDLADKLEAFAQVLETPNLASGMGRRAPLVRAALKCLREQADLLRANERDAAEIITVLGPWTNEGAVSVFGAPSPQMILRATAAARRIAGEPE